MSYHDDTWVNSPEEHLESLFVEVEGKESHWFHDVHVDPVRGRRPTGGYGSIGVSSYYFRVRQRVRITVDTPPSCSPQQASGYKELVGTVKKIRKRERENN